MTWEVRGVYQIGIEVGTIILNLEHLFWRITDTTTIISSTNMTKWNIQLLLPEKFKILFLRDRLNPNVVVAVRNCFKKIEIEKSKLENLSIK